MTYIFHKSSVAKRLICSEICWYTCKLNFFTDRVTNILNYLPNIVDFSSFSVFKHTLKRVNFVRYNWRSFIFLCKRFCYKLSLLLWAAVRAQPVPSCPVLCSVHAIYCLFEQAKWRRKWGKLLHCKFIADCASETISKVNQSWNGRNQSNISRWNNATYWNIDRIITKTATRLNLKEYNCLSVMSDSDRPSV